MPRRPSTHAARIFRAPGCAWWSFETEHPPLMAHGYPSERAAKLAASGILKAAGLCFYGHRSARSIGGNCKDCAALARRRYAEWKAA